MRAILSAIASLIAFRLRSRASLELELIAVRSQLAVLRRKQKKKLHVPLADRFFWAWLYGIWPRALDVMVLVRPKTVMEWHRQGFRLYWGWRSRSKRPWRKVSPELRELIRQMRMDNPLWGAGRIHGELLKLGFNITKRTVHKHLPKRFRPPSPKWRLFLREHMHETVGVDMFVVFTLTFRILFAIVLISHERRKIIHFDVTADPNSDWLARQMVQAFQSNARPRYVLRDRDKMYGRSFHDCLKEMKVQELVTARQSPWQNIYVERVIGSIRSECLNHIIVVNERHLRRVLSSYVHYYNYARTHASLGEDCPETRAIEPPSAGSKIVAIPEVGGLHHRYTRRAA